MSRTRLAEFGRFAWRVAVAHSLTYFLFGLVASTLFDYASLFTRDVIRDYMRPVEASGAVGLAVQPLRGLVFALALWPLRRFILERRHGWLLLWSLIVLIGIVSTPAAAPASIEGIVYSRLPLWYHLIGLPEMLGQTLAFSAVLVWWERRAAAQAARPDHGRRSSPVVEAMKVISIACFAYVGYAAGALSWVALSHARVSTGAAAGSLRTQLMFVVAFAANVAAIALVSRRWRAGKMASWQLFLLFWAIDSATPFLYRVVVFGRSSPAFAAFLGLLPAVVILLGVRSAFPRRTAVAPPAAEPAAASSAADPGVRG